MTADRPIFRRAAQVLATSIRVLIGGVFIWSSLPKIRRPYDFLAHVYEYELVGPKLGMVVAMVLPWLELLVGVCLLGGIFVGGALLVSILLTGLFVFVQASALYRGLAIACGCFSAASPQLISYSTLIRTGLLLLAAVLAYVWLLVSQGSRSLPGPRAG